MVRCDVEGITHNFDGLVVYRRKLPLDNRCSASQNLFIALQQICGGLGAVSLLGVAQIDIVNHTAVKRQKVDAEHEHGHRRAQRTREWLQADLKAVFMVRRHAGKARDAGAEVNWKACQNGLVVLILGRLQISQHEFVPTLREQQRSLGYDHDGLRPVELLTAKLCHVLSRVQRSDPDVLNELHGLMVVLKHATHLLTKCRQHGVVHDGTHKKGVGTGCCLEAVDHRLHNAGLRGAQNDTDIGPRVCTRLHLLTAPHRLRARLQIAGNQVDH